MAPFFRAAFFRTTFFRATRSTQTRHWLRSSVQRTTLVGLWFALAALGGLTSCISSPTTPAVEDAAGGEDGTANVARYVLAAEGTVGAETLTLNDKDSGLTLFVPGNAAPVGTVIQVYRATWPTSAPTSGKADNAAQQQDPWRIDGAQFRIEPAALTLSKPATLLINIARTKLTLPAVSTDLGWHRRAAGETRWRRMAEPVARPNLYYPPNLLAKQDTTRLGDVAVRLYDPRDAAPNILQVGDPPIATAKDGPLTSIAPQGLLTLFGHNFGWDASNVQVHVDGELRIPTKVHNSFVDFPLWVAQPIKDRVIDVTVSVSGRKSNAVQLRIRGLKSGKIVIKNVQRPYGTFPGKFFSFEFAQAAGSTDTMRVHVAGKTMKVEQVKGYQGARLPLDTPPGLTELTIDDGIGGPPSDPIPFYVLPNEPLSLTAGAAAGGVWLPPLSQGVMSQGLELSLNVAHLEPDLSPAMSPAHMSAFTGDVHMRVTTPAGTSDWLHVNDGDHKNICWGTPSGPCGVTIPSTLLVGLKAGDTIQVVLRKSSRLHGVDQPPFSTDNPERLTYRQTPSLTLTVLGRAVIGGRPYFAVPGVGVSGAPCPPTYRQPVALADVICLTGLSSTAGSSWMVSAAGLWPGLAAFRGKGQRGVTEVCGRVKKTGVFHVTNTTTQGDCTIEVVETGGSPVETYSSEPYFADVDQPLVLGGGGGRLTIPPHALPALPAGKKYSISILAPRKDAPNNGPIQTGDPQVATELGTYRLWISPEPKKLLKPLHLSLPINSKKAANKPQVGLFGGNSSLPYELKGVVKAGQIAVDLAAGVYDSASQPAGTKVALPARFNIAFKSIGVIYHKDKPGQISDAMNRFVVDYVVDPKSPDYVTENHAMLALTAAVKAWTTLKTRGWKPPKGPTKLSLRAKVSWASSTADGATGNGVYGTPQITIRSGIQPGPKLRYTIAHEVGHLFQRQYTTNLSLSWLDEAVAEWAAYTTVGKEFDVTSLSDAEGAVVLTLAGFPNSWKGMSGDVIYGSAIWSLWLAAQYGDAAVRKLYTLLNGNKSYWVDPRKTFSDATGKSIITLMHDFAEDFWLNRFDPITKVRWGDDLIKLKKNTVWTLTAKGGFTSNLVGRPALSSRRYLLNLSQKALDAVGAGDVVILASGMGSWAELSLWRDQANALNPGKPTLIKRLTDAAPVVVLHAPKAQKIWMIHNRSATSGIGNGYVTVAAPRLKSLSPGVIKMGNLQTYDLIGMDFGSAKGKVHMAGADVQVTGWQPTSVRVVLKGPPNTSSVTMRVITAQGAHTNDLTVPVVK